VSAKTLLPPLARALFVLRFFVERKARRQQVIRCRIQPSCEDWKHLSIMPHARGSRMRRSHSLHEAYQQENGEFDSQKVPEPQKDGRYVLTSATTKYQPHTIASTHDPWAKRITFSMLASSGASLRDCASPSSVPTANACHQLRPFSSPRSET
jgi:hypothetical protein